MKGCFIVGSGFSAKDFVPPDGVTIVAVNGAIEWLERADYFFTLDPSKENLRRLDCPREGVKYFAALPRDEDYGVPYTVGIFDRISARGSQPIKKYSPEWWLWRWSAVRGLSECPTQIHSGNSAFGALGLAYHLGYRKAALIGVDATRVRIEGGESENLSHLRLLFESATDQMRIVNCGLMKTSIPHMTVPEATEWLRGET